jgi:peptidoglycan/LPS O-acetylase OafA/YrhL
VPGAIVLIQHHGKPVWAKFSLSPLDAMRPSAYGIYLVHYIFIIWLQYAVYDYSWPAFIKFAIVFTKARQGVGHLSWHSAKYPSWRG